VFGLLKNLQSLFPGNGRKIIEEIIKPITRF